jgi:RND family efflux transporter MFP subunit
MPHTRLGRSQPPPVILAMLLLAAGCSSPLSGGLSPQPGDPTPGPREAASEPTAASVRVVHPEPVPEDTSFPSSLYVEKDVRVTARRSGIIEKVLVDRGGWVKAGDPLALLETDVAARELELAEQDLRLAASEYERLEALHGQGIASAQEFQKAEIARDQATSRVGLARTMLEQCNVRAPFAGRVVERWAVVGKRIREEDDVPLFRIVASEPLRARVDVPEERVVHIRLGEKASVRLADGGEAPRPARVVYVGPAIDAASGAAPVIVEVASAAESLRVGQSVQVRFDESDSRSLREFRLPREAIAALAAGEDGGASLFVVSEGRVAARRVDLIRTEGGAVRVRGSLSPSDLIIVSGLGKVAEGDRVRAEEGTP